MICLQSGHLLVLDLTGLNPGLDLVLVVLQLLDLLLEVLLELLLLVRILGVVDLAETLENHEKSCKILRIGGGGEGEE